MFRHGGTLYVYLIYGVHYCLNVVTGPAGRGEAVLLRALEPVWGESEMARLRGLDRNNGENPGLTGRPDAAKPTGRQAEGGTGGASGDRRGQRRLKGISDGPGKIAQALAVTGAEDGSSLLHGPLRLLMPDRPMDPDRIGATERVGISKGVEKKWRFVDAESELLSRPFRR